MPFDPYFPIPSKPGDHWIEWHEVLYVNSKVLVRCVPLPDAKLPEHASAVLLHFDGVVGLRASEDPFNLEKTDLASGAPRESNGHITSLLLRGTSTPWIEEASPWFPEPLYHFVILDVQDHAVGVLTREPYPAIRLEHAESEPEPYPNAFHTWRTQ